MPKPNLGKTGNAPIVQQGHTADGKYGSDPGAQGKGKRKVTDLKAK